MRDGSEKRPAAGAARRLGSNPIAFALVYDRVQQIPPDYFRLNPFPHSTLLADWAAENEWRAEMKDLQEGFESVPGSGWPSWFAEHWSRLKKEPFYVALGAALEIAPRMNLSAKDVLDVLVDVSRGCETQNRGWYSTKYAELITAAKAQYEAIKTVPARVDQASEAYRGAAEAGRQLSGLGPSVTEDSMVVGVVDVELEQKDAATAQPQTGAERFRAAHPQNQARPAAHLKPLATPESKPEFWPTAEAMDAFGHCSVDGALESWFGSHIGPRYSEKQENQDAVWVEAGPDDLIFALSDGVGSSFGARFAAIGVSQSFTGKVRELLETGVIPAHALQEACGHCQIWLDSAMRYLLTNPDAPEWSDVRGPNTLTPDVIEAAMNNTITRSRKWSPVFATTLIGGIVTHRRDGSTEVHTARIGDGQVEILVSGEFSGECQPLFVIDAEELAINSSLSPGPVGKASIDRIEVRTAPVNLGAILLVSSDGLTRGHASTIAAKLTELIPDLRSRFDVKKQDAVPLLLGAAADYADEQFRQTSNTKLFGDNLSLIVIRSNT